MLKPADTVGLSMELASAGSAQASDELLALLIPVGVSRSWAADQVLHWADECPTSVLCVLEGRLKLRRFDSEGREQILSWFEAGGVVAVAFVISNKPIHFDMVADGPCKVLHVDRWRFMELLQKDAAVSMAIINLVSERLVFLMDSHATQTSEALAERLWHRLTRMAQQSILQGTPRHAGILITQQELASAVGASRFRVGLELQKLAGRGLIEMSRGRIRLSQPKSA